MKKENLLKAAKNCFETAEKRASEIIYDYNQNYIDNCKKDIDFYQKQIELDPENEYYKDKINLLKFQLSDYDWREQEILNKLKNNYEYQLIKEIRFIRDNYYNFAEKAAQLKKFLKAEAEAINEEGSEILFEESSKFTTELEEAKAEIYEAETANLTEEYKDKIGESYWTEHYEFIIKEYKDQFINFNNDSMYEQIYNDTWVSGELSYLARKLMIINDYYLDSFDIYYEYQF